LKYARGLPNSLEMGENVGIMFHEPRDFSKQTNKEISMTQKKQAIWWFFPSLLEPRDGAMGKTD
jgi:hypothetical protein